MNAKRLFAAILSVMMAVLLAACSGAPAAQTTPTAAPAVTPETTEAPGASATPEFATNEEMVKTFIQFFYGEEYDKADAMISQEIADKLVAMGGVRGLAATILAQTGKLISMTEVEQRATHEGVVMYQLPIMTEKGRFNAQVGINPEQKVAAFAIRPGVEDPIVMPEGFVEETVTVDAGKGCLLEGRLVKPAKSVAPVTGVVLVQGSGATDYDEIVGANRIFGQIARGLAERGIASLRYTKRTFAYPAIQQEKDYSIETEYVEDVFAAVKLMQNTEGVDAKRVFLLGHSQGAMLAPLFAERGADVKGMILMAGSPRNLLDILIDQQELMLAASAAQGVPEEQLNDYKKQQETWEAERKNLDTLTAEQAMEAGTVYEFNAYYVYVLNQYDALKTIQSLKKPMLILQGENDFQIFANKDFEAYKQAIGSESYVSMELYPGLNHLFMPSKGQDISAALNEYNIPAQIPAKVFDDIADWVNAQK